MDGAAAICAAAGFDTVVGAGVAVGPAATAGARTPVAGAAAGDGLNNGGASYDANVYLFEFVPDP